jgi:hypothetical protein
MSLKIYHRLGLLLIGLVLSFGLLSPIRGRPALAQDGGQQAPGELLRQAAQAAFEQSAGEQDYEIGAVEIVGDWALVSFRLGLAVDPEKEPGWTVRLGLARWDGSGWQIALEDSPEFVAWLDQLPEELIPSEARAYLNPTVSMASDAPGLWLPFPVGQTWKFLAGPHGDLGREAVDFGPFSPLERTRPNPLPEPPLTGRERDVTAAATGLVVDWDTNLLILRHGSNPAWETGYFALAAATNNSRLGQLIYQGEVIGAASSEGTRRTEDHVHFWVRRDGVDQGINGQLLSDWRIFQDNSYEVGQNAGRMVYRGLSERVDCATVERARLPEARCHIAHTLAVADPLPPIAVTLEPTQTITVPVGSQASSQVVVSGANLLYKVNLHLVYTPADLVQVIDAFPGTPGIQVDPGQVFENRPLRIIRNEVDLSGGVIEFEAELQPPAQAFSGEGSLIEIAWERQAMGDVTVTLAEVHLADANGRTIPVDPTDPVVIKSGFVVVGEVELQGRSDWSGVIITADNRQTQTNVDGQFSLGLAGHAPLKLTAPGYLSVRIDQELWQQPAEGEQRDLGRLRLPAGDINADEQIDILDLAFIAGRYGRPDTQADLNGDGIVDILDLTLTASNYHYTAILSVGP